MRHFRIIKLSKKVIIFQLRISKHKLLELQLEFNISDGIETLKPFVNKLIVLDNQALINELPLDISLKEAWNDINKKIADKFYDEQSKLA